MNKNGYATIKHNQYSDTWDITLACPFIDTYYVICKWADENLQNEWKYVDHTGWRPNEGSDGSNGSNEYGYSTFLFTTKESAMAFLLRWG